MRCNLEAVGIAARRALAPVYNGCIALMSRQQLDEVTPLGACAEAGFACAKRSQPCPELFDRQGLGCYCSAFPAQGTAKNLCRRSHSGVRTCPRCNRAARLPALRVCEEHGRMSSWCAEIFG